MDNAPLVEKKGHGRGSWCPISRKRGRTGSKERLVPLRKEKERAREVKGVTNARALEIEGARAVQLSVGKSRRRNKWAHLFFLLLFYKMG
jgi:hypothetical protein